jgi:hypothetical protein
METLLGAVEDEFRDAEIPDWRLRERLITLSRSLDENPAAAMPRATKSEAEREAAYRFLGNRRVTMPGILEPHVRATVKRCQEKGSVYVVSDSTVFRFSGERGENLGRVQSGIRGFIGHFALAVSADGRRVPLGVLGIETIVRSETPKGRRIPSQARRDPTRESLKWSRLVEQTSQALGDVTAVHVMDSDADIYELMAELTVKNRRFIIRASQDRVVEEGLLSEAIEAAPILLEREVQLSPRKQQTRLPVSRRRTQPREARLAQLTISSRAVTLQRPRSCSEQCPTSIVVNVVRVFERNPPDDQDPVEWVLLTSEPVSTVNEVSAVVDGYRVRWLIEEYFKALKTGCAYETRQHESIRSLSNLLAMLAVIAYRLLLIRSLQRMAPQTPASGAIDARLVEALAALLRHRRVPKPLPGNPTIADVFHGIARLGGHITSNGPPGWQVLWRGYHDLLTWGGGYIHGKSIGYSDP